MAGEVSVDHAAYNKANQQYGDVVPAIRQTVNSIAQSVDASAGGWQGVAATSFHQFHGRLHEALGKVNQSLQEVSELLGQGHQKYSASDDHNATFGSLNL